MSDRFDRFRRKENQEDKQSVLFKKKLTDIIEEESPLFKYSALFGKYFFRIRPLKSLALGISRKLFSKYPNYKERSEEELKIASGLTGAFYLTIVLILIFLSGGGLKESLTFGSLGLLWTLFNFKTISTYLKLGKIGSVQVSSGEILSFLSWLVLLLEAGMNLDEAFKHYSKEEKGNLPILIEYALEEVRSSHYSFDESLGNLATEVSREDLREIFMLILQSKKQGVSIKDMLYGYFDRYQTNLQAIADKKGSEANQKATFVLTGEVMLLMLVFMIALIGSISLL